VAGNNGSHLPEGVCWILYTPKWWLKTSNPCYKALKLPTLFNAKLHGIDECQNLIDFAVKHVRLRVGLVLHYQRPLFLAHVIQSSLLDWNKYTISPPSFVDYTLRRAHQGRMGVVVGNLINADSFDN
jgi:hypothetical protein